MTDDGYHNALTVLASLAFVAVWLVVYAVGQVGRKIREVMIHIRNLLHGLLFLLKGRLHLCQHDGCLGRAYPCYLPESDAPDGWYCWEHMFRQGFCRLCGTFWGGIEEFDFGTGYCPTCKDELDADTGELEGDEEYVFAGDVP